MICRAISFLDGATPHPLTRGGQHDGRKLGCDFLEERFKGLSRISSDHGLPFSLQFCISNAKL